MCFQDVQSQKLKYPSVAQCQNLEKIPSYSVLQEQINMLCADFQIAYERFKTYEELLGLTEECLQKIEKVIVVEIL